MSHRALGAQFEDDDLADQIRALPSVQKLQAQAADIDHTLAGVTEYLAPKPERDEPKLYHGTAHEITSGMVLPASALPPGSTQWRGFYENPGEEWRKDRVFAVAHERSAWSWAQGRGRPRAHEIELNDAEPAAGVGGEFHGSSARIKQTHWGPPPPKNKPDAWTQPALSPINWVKHGSIPNYVEHSGEEPSAELKAARFRKATQRLPSHQFGQLRLF